MTVDLSFIDAFKDHTEAFKCQLQATLKGLELWQARVEHRLRALEGHGAADPMDAAAAAQPRGAAPAPRHAQAAARLSNTKLLQLENDRPPRHGAGHANQHLVDDSDAESECPSEMNTPGRVGSTGWGSPAAARAPVVYKPCYKSAASFRSSSSSSGCSEVTQSDIESPTDWVRPATDPGPPPPRSSPRQKQVGFASSTEIDDCAGAAATELWDPGPASLRRASTQATIVGLRSVQSATVLRSFQSSASLDKDRYAVADGLPEREPTFFLDHAKQDEQLASLYADYRVLPPGGPDRVPSQPHPGGPDGGVPLEALLEPPSEISRRSSGASTDKGHDSHAMFMKLYTSTADFQWMDVIGNPDYKTEEFEAYLSDLHEKLGIHALTIKDCLTPYMLPKVERIGAWTGMILRYVPAGEMNLHLTAVHEASFKLVMLMSDNMLITIRRVQAYTDFPKVAELVNDWKADMTLQELVNRFIYDIMSGFRTSLNTIGDEFDACDGDVLASVVSARRRDGAVLVQRLYDVQRLARSYVTLLERSRVVIHKYFKLCKNKDPFTEDIHDQLSDLRHYGQTLHENTSALLQLHLSLIDFRTNQLLYVLTIITVLFVPITFIAGVYGNNLLMPEYKWTYGALFFWGLCGGIVLVTLIFLKSKRFV